MRDLSYLKEYYTGGIEDNRLVSKHGQVEFITTMKYIHNHSNINSRILEVGAGTGRYSLALAHEGYNVEAVELVEDNLNVLKSNIQPDDNINAHLGDALDLSRYKDETFDITLVLGPMYHLYNDEDKKKALSEAVRVTKKNGYIMIAYCMNEATMICFGFKEDNIKDMTEGKLLTEDYHCKSSAEEIFELVRLEDIDRINKDMPVEREKLIATDGATNYMRDIIDNMPEDTYKLYLDYHLSTCERQDLIGASHHTLDILKRL